jgi:hypothetical protein
VRIVSHGGLGCDGAPDGSGWQTGGGLYAEPLDEASGQSGSGRDARGVVGRNVGSSAGCGSVAGIIFPDAGGVCANGD